jgi:hypothetical protein
MCADNRTTDLSDLVYVAQLEQSRLQCEDGYQTQGYYINGNILANCVSVSKQRAICERTI